MGEKRAGDIGQRYAKRLKGRESCAEATTASIEELYTAIYCYCPGLLASSRLCIVSPILAAIDLDLLSISWGCIVTRA